MTAAHALLAEVHRRGAVAYRVGDRLRIRPAVAVPPELVDRLRAHKAELLALVPDGPPADTAPAADYQRIYNALTATFGDAEDLRAFAAVYDAGAHDLPERLAELEGDCEQLTRDGADETTYRQAVERLVAFVRDVRAEYQRAHQPTPDLATPAAGGPVVVGIAGDRCLTCSGTTYHLPAVKGVVLCAHCNPKPSLRRQRRGAT